MSPFTAAPRNLQPVAVRRRRDTYLAALMLSTAGVLALLAIGERTSRPLTFFACVLALAPITLAAFNRRGWRTALAAAAVFSTAYLPVALTGEETRASAAFTWAFYTLVLVACAFVMSALASFTRERSALTGAVRDWESLLARASSLAEVALFTMQEARKITAAQSAELLVRNPIADAWEMLCLQGGVLQRRQLEAVHPDLSLALWLVQQAEPEILNNLDGDPRFVGARQAGLRSVLSQPLISPAGQTMALLVLVNKADSGFEPSDLEDLRDLSSAAEQALLQAGAVARSDDILARRMHQLSALQRSARDLNALVDPQQIVNRTLAFALEISHGDAAVVGVDLPGTGLITAVYNSNLTASQLSQVVGSASQLSGPRHGSDNSTLLPSLMSDAGARLVVPLRRQGRASGIIMVEAAQPSAFDEEAPSTLASLADQAAVALDNACLFDQILREKRKSERIVHDIADALLTVDSQGRITSFNPAASVLTGWRAEEALGHGLCDILACCDDGKHLQDCQLWAALQSHTPIFADHWQMRQRLGSQRIVALSGAPLEQEDQPGGLVVLMHDVTEQRKMEQFQQELIATFSHELRTPLANIAAIAQLMLAEEDAAHGLGAAAREPLLLLQAQSRRLEEFAERFLTLAQIEQEGIGLERRPVAIGLAAQDVVRQWQAIHPQRLITLSAPRHPIWASADEQAVYEVLDVLLDNACKYSPANTPIEVLIDHGAADCVTLCVRDQGPGLAPEDQMHIFDRFYRVDNSDARTVYGHGLGLYIARRLVEAMGGQIWVESTVGAGSCFTFTLPLLSWEDLNEDPDY
jgi:PAS domain S-box-containing protein